MAARSVASMSEAFIVEAVRTPVGRRGGGLSQIHPADLGGHVIRSLMERSKVDPHAVEDVDLRVPRRDRPAGRRHRSHVRSRRRAARARPRGHDRPPVRVGPAVGALRGAGGHVRHDGCRHRRRRAEHVAGADPGVGRARPGRGIQPVHELAGLEHDLRSRRGQPVRRRRDDGRQVGPQPRRDGGVRGRVARAGAACAGRGPVRQRDRPDQRRRARRGAARAELGQDPLTQDADPRRQVHRRRRQPDLRRFRRDVDHERAGGRTSTASRRGRASITCPSGPTTRS